MSDYFTWDEENRNLHEMRRFAFTTLCEFLGEDMNFITKESIEMYVETVTFFICRALRSYDRKMCGEESLSLSSWPPVKEQPYEITIEADLRERVEKLIGSYEEKLHDKLL